MIAREICRFTEVVEESQGQIDHFPAARTDLRAASKPCEIVSNIAVVLLDPEGQVLAGEELRLGDAAVVTVPVVRQEDPAFDADFREELLAGRIVTLTQNPVQGSPFERIEGSPEPAFVFFHRRNATSHRVARSRHPPASRVPAGPLLPCESI